MGIETENVQDIDQIKERARLLKNVQRDLKQNKVQLETTAFDVQFFISEYAQDLSPSQSRQLLRLLNSTQKCFLDVQASVTTQMDRLEIQLQLEQQLDHQKVCSSCGVRQKFFCLFLGKL